MEFRPMHSDWGRQEGRVAGVVPYGFAYEASTQAWRTRSRRVKEYAAACSRGRAILVCRRASPPWRTPWRLPKT